MRVPEHDHLTQAVQNTVREATDRYQAEELRAKLEYGPVSTGMIKKIRDWRPGDPSFQLDKLLKAHDWAIENLS